MSRCSVNLFITDLQAARLQLRVNDDSVFENYESDELHDPRPRKVDGKRTIYQSRRLSLPTAAGHIILCDLGEARFGKATYTDDIQPYVHRAPEVILEMPWSYEVDIWNVGVLVWQ